MFPPSGFQIIIEPGSTEDFHVVEVRNVSRDELNVACLVGMASVLHALFMLSATPAGRVWPPEQSLFNALEGCG
jgi:hypothetical protein